MKALLIDLDGVVRIWRREWTEAVEAAAGLPQGAILEVAFAPELLMPAVTGKLRDEEWRLEIAARLRAQFPGVHAAAAIARWSEPVGEVDDRVLSLVQHVRPKAPAALVTNATTRLEIDLQRLGLVSCFDHVVNSAALGAAKPEEAIFEHALSLVDAPPADALFVDDTAINVEAAAALGLQTHHFAGADALEQALRRSGLLPK